MFRILLGLALTTSLASAGPLATKWRAAGCPEFGVLHTDKELAFVDRKAQTVVHRDIATGKLLAPTKIKFKKGNLEAWLGDTMVISEYGKDDLATLSGIDAAGKSKWTGVKGGKFAAVDGTDLVVGTFAKGVVMIARVAGATGKPAWTATVPGSGSLHTFTVDGGRILVGTNDEKAKAFTASVIDAKAGTVTWTTKLPFKTYRGGLLDTNAIVVDEEKIGTNKTAFHFLDLATGKETATAEILHAFPAIAGGGRVFVGSNDLDKKVGSVTALDTKTGKQLWSVKTPAFFDKFYGFGGGGIAANIGNDVMRILDVTNGNIIATYGIEAQEFDGKTLTMCDDKEFVALGSGGTDETAKITGTIQCKNCADKELPVRIGDVTGKTDAKGKFSLTVTGTGRLPIRVPYESDDGYISEPGKSILFAGKGAYDVGTIKVEVEANGD